MHNEDLVTIFFGQSSAFSMLQSHCQETGPFLTTKISIVFGIHLIVQGRMKLRADMEPRGFNLLIHNVPNAASVSDYFGMLCIKGLKQSPKH